MGRHYLTGFALLIFKEYVSLKYGFKRLYDESINISREEMISCLWLVPGMNVFEGIPLC